MKNLKFNFWSKIFGLVLFSFLTVASLNAQTKGKKKKVETASTKVTQTFETTTTMGCKRLNVPTVSQLKNELNKIERCSGERACTGNSTFSEFETKTLTVYQSPNQGGNNLGFNVAKQDEVMQQAKDLANAQAPNCGSGNPKVIYKMNFSYCIDEDAFNGPFYQVKANVTYACCSGLRDN